MRLCQSGSGSVRAGVRRGWLLRKLLQINKLRSSPRWNTSCTIGLPACGIGDDSPPVGVYP